MDKLNDISKDYLSKLSPETLYTLWLAWAKQWDCESYTILVNNKELAIRALAIGKLGNERRRDLCTWKQATKFMSMYFDETYQIEASMPERLQKTDAIQFLEDYLNSYLYEDEKDVWFEKLKVIISNLGFAVKPKDYKNSQNYIMAVL